MFELELGLETQYTLFNNKIFNHEGHIRILLQSSDSARNNSGKIYFLLQYKSNQIISRIVKSNIEKHTKKKEKNVNEKWWNELN